MNASHFLKEQDHFIESPNHSTLLKPSLLLVDVEPEFSSLLRHVLGDECTFLETMHFNQAKILSYFESIDIALISIKGSPHPPNKSLDLILNLVDSHPHISIFLSLDRLDPENSRTYFADGMIENFTIDSDQNALIHQIGNLIQKEKGKNCVPNTLKPPPLRPFSNKTIENTKAPHAREMEEGPGLNKNPFQVSDLYTPPPELQNIDQEEIPIDVPSAPLLKTSLQEGDSSSQVVFRKISELEGKKILKDIPVSFSPRNKQLIKNLVQELAHKIKNPLVSIKTFTDLLKGRFQDASFREEFYPIVKIEIERINQTIESLVDFSEQLESQTLQTDFWPLFLESLDSFNQKNHGFFKPSFHEETLPVFLIDPHQCQFALHLLYNSLLDNLKNHTEIKITAGKYPNFQSESDSLLIINFFLPAPIPRFLEHLEVILTQWILENFNAQLEETFLDGQPILHLIFFPLSKPPTQNSQWQPPLPSNDRRKKQILIVFYDRRKSDRRQEASALSFEDRRKSR